MVQGACCGFDSGSEAAVLPTESAGMLVPGSLVREDRACREVDVSKT